MSLPKPYYTEGKGDRRIVIYHGDCRKIVPELPANRIGLVLTDPPWGNRTQCDSRRFSCSWWADSKRARVVSWPPIRGDTEPFDPQPLLKLRCPMILWGANHYADKLPVSGGWLVWDKRKGAEGMAAKGWPLGEAELAWTNVIGATRVFRNLWSGLLRSSECGEFYHPTQKPVALMAWCLGFAAGVACDPYMGSGSTLVAAKGENRGAVGIEIEESYCQTAATRLAQGVLEFSDVPGDTRQTPGG